MLSSRAERDTNKHDTVLIIGLSDTAGLDLSGERAETQLKFGLTKTIINNARQLSRNLVSIYHGCSVV